ncbi:MAG: hypothetical protein FWD97_06055 [Defluviitaleaceae bacterium]|nr:hypothetical protein [Defluviitaleaceae bacterium]
MKFKRNFFAMLLAIVMVFSVALVITEHQPIVVEYQNTQEDNLTGLETWTSQGFSEIYRDDSLSVYINQDLLGIMPQDDVFSLIEEFYGTDSVIRILSYSVADNLSYDDEMFQPLFDFSALEETLENPKP